MKPFDVEIFDPHPPRIVPDTARIVSALQNATLHPLDLLVRESIQNSLDAALDENKKRDVRVQFSVGDFDVDRFADYLGTKCAARIKIGLKKFHPGRRFISIRDSECSGLTGDPASKDSNLYKLVYGFLDGKDSDNAAAGGSYGVGKTVFLHFGIGFVCYYSQTKKGQYLALFYCNNNNRRDLFDKSFMPYQLAWWGRYADGLSGAVDPVTDGAFISQFLSVFGVKPYREGETGTTVIIPFFNEEIANNERRDFAPWLNSIHDYLRFSVLKWYVPRFRGDLKLLANDSGCDFRSYRWGRFLRCTFPDNKPLSLLDSQSISVGEKKIFGLIRDLYDVAIGSMDPPKEVYRIQVEHRNSAKHNLYFASPTIGWFAIKKINYIDGEYGNTNSVLSALAPENSIEDRRGFVLYCRKPGMIMTYDDSWGRVLSQVNKTSAEFFVGIFVVNSDNVVYSDPAKLVKLCPLDQLFRETEKSDHYGWPSDAYSHGIKLVNSIIAQLKRDVSSRYSEIDQDPSLAAKGDISRGLGGVFMSGRTGFGGSPDFPEGNGGIYDPGAGEEGNNGAGKGSNSQGRSGKTKRTIIKFGDPSFQADGDGVIVKVPIQIHAAKNDTDIRFDVAVETDGAPLTADQWNLNDGAFPIKALSFYPLGDKQSCEVKCEINAELATFDIDLSAAVDHTIDWCLAYSVDRTDMSTLLLRKDV